VKKWIYKDLAATVGVKKALLKESPPRERDVPLQDDGHERQHRRAARARTGHGPDPRDRAGGRHAPLLRRAPPHLHEQRDEGPLRAVMHRGPGWCESPPESPHVPTTILAFPLRVRLKEKEASCPSGSVAAWRPARAAATCPLRPLRPRRSLPLSGSREDARGTTDALRAPPEDARLEARRRAAP